MKTIRKMTLMFLLSLLFSCLSEKTFSQSKNSYIIGYGGAAFFEFKNQHHFFNQYVRQIKNSNFSFSVRSEFGLYETTYNRPFSDIKNMVVMPEADFYFDGIVDYDDTDIGLKQLVSYDGHEIETSIRGLLGYQFSPIKRLEIATFMGAGLIYFKDQGLFSGQILEVKDQNYPNEQVVLLFNAYKRGLYFVSTGVIQINFHITDKLFIGTDWRIDYSLIEFGGISIYDDFLIGFKF
jgi:hypothetical protein